MGQNSDILIIENSHFHNNSALYKGGVLMVEDIKNVKIFHSSFKDNTVLFSKEKNIQEKDEFYTISQGGAINI